MEDLRYESTRQFLALSENDLNEMINGTTLIPLNASLVNITSDHLVNSTLTDSAKSQIPPEEWYIIIYSIFIIAAIILTPLSRNVCYIIYMRASKNLHNKMFSNILKAPMRFFDTNPSGK